MRLGGAEATLFFFGAPLAVAGALALLFARKAVHAAVGMALTMVLLGVFYIAEQAEFLGIIQIFVYSGAVMMLFLFVIMLVGVDSSDSLVETIRGQRIAGILLALAVMCSLLVSVAKISFGAAKGLKTVNETTGNVSGLANLIFGPYVWAFEVTSALLITAAIGAMLLAHRERLRPKASQADWARARVRSNKYVAGLPVPGVYARSNAADLPALLPDGTPAEASVQRVLRARGQVAPPGPNIAAALEIEGEAGDMTSQEVADQRGDL
ncbi:NADH-quinone oxidoreductase subunit J [Flexivirga oryzae]|uniref:NADH-quinone oxidoreductase subunit J n=1 Tax=Flexivirga oryzae TaxID=1794944 RepID=A0A839NJC5_9MICO|nr:NADH-quinone oxidoreductase subunit J [Flexivirga oryzae]MBB2894751.1 NADH-quinone oxidoreductase subunit J [Flexivirga oryzae]